MYGILQSAYVNVYVNLIIDKNVYFLMVVNAQDTKGLVLVTPKVINIEQFITLSLSFVLISYTFKVKISQMFSFYIRTSLRGNTINVNIYRKKLAYSIYSLHVI